MHVVSPTFDCFFGKIATHCLSLCCPSMIEEAFLRHGLNTGFFLM